LNFPDKEKIGKNGISRKKRKGRQDDGRRAVIPSECEGSKKKISRFARNKDFSPWSKWAGRGLCELSVLGAISFLKLILFNNSLVSIYHAYFI